MGSMAFQITSLSIVYSVVYSGADQRKHQGSGSLDFVRGINWGLVNSPHKGPVMRKMFPFDDVIMNSWKCLGAYFWCLHVYAPGHQYLWFWLNILCVGPISCMNITLIVNNTEKHNHIKKMPNCFKVKVGQSSCLITTGNILWLSHYSITAFSGCFQYQIKLLILRSCEMGKLHVLKWSYRFEILQVSWKQCHQTIAQNIDFGL